MPTYEYQCRKCGHDFEVFQSMRTGALKKCPACGKLALKRLIGTGGAILFKGSGFYATDYRSASYQQAAKAESENNSQTDKSAKSESETEKKSAASSDSKKNKKSS